MQVNIFHSSIQCVSSEAINAMHEHTVCGIVKSAM